MLNSKLVADYTEMIDQYLDYFNISNIQEFKEIELALTILLELQ